LLQGLKVYARIADSTARSSPRLPDFSLNAYVIEPVLANIDKPASVNYIKFDAALGYKFVAIAVKDSHFTGVAEYYRELASSLHGICFVVPMLNDVGYFSFCFADLVEG
jgi:hypothetical protein